MRSVVLRFYPINETPFFLVYKKLQQRVALIYQFETVETVLSPQCNSFILVTFRKRLTATDSNRNRASLHSFRRNGFEHYIRRSEATLRPMDNSGNLHAVPNGAG